MQRKVNAVRRYASTEYMNADFPFWIKRFRLDKDRIPHSHDFVELVCVEYGEGIHEFEGECYGIGPGDVFIINPGEVHTYKIEKGQVLEVINCLFTPALIDESVLRELNLLDALDFLYVLPFLDDQQRFHHRLTLGKTESQIMLQLLERMLVELEQKNSGYQSLIKMNLLEILVLLSRYQKEQKQDKGCFITDNQLRARRIRGYLERHAFQAISVDELAGLFHVSARQLNRILKKETGQSVTETVHRIRIERAKKLLRETDETIISVATSVGYESPSFFNSLFMRHVGCTPGNYRLGNYVFHDIREKV